MNMEQAHDCIAKIESASMLPCEYYRTAKGFKVLWHTIDTVHETTNYDAFIRWWDAQSQREHV